MTISYYALKAIIQHDTEDADNYTAIRELLLDPETPEQIIGEITDNPVNTDALRHLLKGLDREELTELALSLSLCPLHLIDYAICFDDQTDDCAAIRIIHPSHDT